MQEGAPRKHGSTEREWERGCRSLLRRRVRVRQRFRGPPLLVVSAGLVSGCATSLQGGVQGSLANDVAAEEASVAVAAGLGDGQGALLVKGRGTFGIEPRTGKRRGTVV